MSGLNRDDINRIIYDNGLFHGTMALGVVMDADHLERFANLVAAAEREACAKACENIYEGDEGCGDWPTPEMCAFAIRERGAP
jgi:hypothetical protein